MTAKTTTTAAALRSILAGSGASDATIEVALRLTAPARHLARVEEAMRAALEYAATGLDLESGAVERMLAAINAGKYGADLPRPSDLLSGDGWALIAAAHAAIEAWVGRGGPCEAGGPGRSTDRAPWAQRLGKGRAHASDGAAWNAALADASKRLAHAAGAWDSVVTLEPTGEGIRACVQGVSALLSFNSFERAYALCVRGLASALPAEAPHRLEELPLECNLQFGGSLEQWVQTLDHVGLAGAASYVADAIGILQDKIPDGVRLRDYIPGIFLPWADRAIAARLEADRREAAA